MSSPCVELRALRSLFLKSNSTLLCLTSILLLISNSKSPFVPRRSFEMRVAFLGLGIMGYAMAANLVKGGHEVTVWNRTPGKMVEEAGIAPNPPAAAQSTENYRLYASAPH